MVKVVKVPHYTGESQLSILIIILFAKYGTLYYTVKAANSLNKGQQQLHFPSVTTHHGNPTLAPGERDYMSVSLSSLTGFLLQQQCPLTGRKFIQRQDNQLTQNHLTGPDSQSHQ